MAKIYYHAVPQEWRKEQKYKFLDEHESVSKIDWTEITPDAKQNWLTEGMEKEFDAFISIGNKQARTFNRPEVKTIFKTYSLGVKTNRDTWAYNFQKDRLATNIQTTIEFFNEQVFRWIKSGKKENIDDFVSNDGSKISWSGTLKSNLDREKAIVFNNDRIRVSIYRFFQPEYLYFDSVLNERMYGFRSIFPNEESESENLTIGVCNHTQVPFSVMSFKYIPCIDVNGRPTQSFPFYTYNEDGTNRRENITDWALEQFREHYRSEPPAVAGGLTRSVDMPGVSNTHLQPPATAGGSDKTAAAITKWDIFYYTYAILHHPEYREKYAANLKRELPRIPFAPDFWGFAEAGKELADIHVNYEDQPEYKLDMIENGRLQLDWKVEKMRYNKEKTAIIYNEFLTIAGIPPEVHEYRLGNRSALDWIVDQYKASIDKRSGITNDPNRDDEPQYIVRLIKKIVTVSLRTNEIVNSLPNLSDATV